MLRESICHKMLGTLWMQFPKGLDHIYETIEDFCQKNQLARESCLPPNKAFLARCLF